MPLSTCVSFSNPFRAILLRTMAEDECAIRYHVVYTQAALKSLERLSPPIARRIMAKIQRLEQNLAGDVKRLTNFTPEYRLRVGDWRVLFDVDEDRVLIQHISHRSQAYR